MRLREMVDGTEKEYEHIEHLISNIKITKFEFPKGMLGKFNYVHEFIGDLRINMIEINNMLSTYARLAKFDFEKVPGSGPVDAALEVVSNLLIDIHQSMSRIPEDFHFRKTEYEHIVSASNEIKKYLSSLINNLHTELNTNHQLNMYAKPLGMLCDALTVLVDAFKQMDKKIYMYISKMSPVQDQITPTETMS